jgi:hypothetical protein
MCAAALVALEGWEEKLFEDNENAWMMMDLMAYFPHLSVEHGNCETNILRFTIDKEGFKNAGVKDYREFVQKLEDVYNIKCLAGFNNDYIRFVTHRHVDKAACEHVVYAVKDMVTPFISTDDGEDIELINTSDEERYMAEQKAKKEEEDGSDEPEPEPELKKRKPRKSPKKD